MRGPEKNAVSRVDPPAPTGPQAALELTDPDRLLEAGDLGWLREHAGAALRHLGVAGEVRARVVADPEMAAAHEEFLGVSGTTDVLTFDLSGPDAASALDLDSRCRILDADILVCVDEARRQATERGHEPRRELLIYLVHGVLHCLGHDDHDEAAAATMHAREDRVLAAIGVGATYWGLR